MSGPQAAWLPDGRLHLNHGPIDLIIEAWGEEGEVEEAYRQAVARFATILTELVAELPALRSPAGLGTHHRWEAPGDCLESEIPPPLKGEGDTRGSSPSPLRGGVRGRGNPGPPPFVPFTSPTARRMHDAVSRLAGHAFITPMAAVAGAVADEMLAAMLGGRRLAKAYVNDGGDIALHVGPGESLRVAIAGAGHGFDDRFTVVHESPVRGVATSGWRGRSHSLGIADAVTALARDAASADAAATLIANAVDLPGHSAVRRRRARELAPDSDLGERPVTVSVGALTAQEVSRALERGLAVAEDFQRRGLIEGAALFLCGQRRVGGSPYTPYPALRATFSHKGRRDRGVDDGALPSPLVGEGGPKGRMRGTIQKRSAHA